LDADATSLLPKSDLDLRMLLLCWIAYKQTKAKTSVEQAKLNELLEEIKMINYEDESRKELIGRVETSVKFDLFKVIEMICFLYKMYISGLMSPRRK